MAADTLLTPEVLGWIGKEAPPHTGDTILDRDVARYAVAVGDLNPVYFDEQTAREDGHRSIPAPVGYIYWCAHPWCRTLAQGRLRPDGTPDDVDPLRPPLQAQRIIRGGDEYEFYGRVYVGDRITLHRRVVDIYERQGRSGAMAFVVEECRYYNQRGELVARQRITRIYR